MTVRHKGNAAEAETIPQILSTTLTPRDASGRLSRLLAASFPGTFIAPQMARRFRLAMLFPPSCTSACIALSASAIHLDCDPAQLATAVMAAALAIVECRHPPGFACRLSFRRYGATLAAYHRA
jgi:hypothetical protein